MRYLLTVITIVIALASSPVAADQKDKRLPPLFDQLSEDIDNAQAHSLELKIWSIWLESGNSDIDELMQQGMVALTVGGYRHAIRLFSEIVERAPDYAEGWNKRATVFYLIGHHRESIDDVEHTLALEPRHFGAIAGLGLNLEALGEKQEAIDAYREALAVNPHLQRIRDRLDHLVKELEDQAI